MIKVQSPNWRKIVRRLKMIDLRSNTHGCELINKKFWQKKKIIIWEEEKKFGKTFLGKK